MGESHIGTDATELPGWTTGHTRRCSQHRGGKLSKLKVPMACTVTCVVDCIAYIVDAERDECLLVGMIAPW